MGLFDFLKRSAGNPPSPPPEEKKLSQIDKERKMVERVTTEDMLQFTMLPYDLNCPVYKFMREGGHPFAYMNLNRANQMVAKQELNKINRYILQAQEYIPLLTSDFSLQVSKVMFEEYSPDYGYSRLMCSPYTFTGKISKYPLSLSFMTRLDVRPYSAHGELVYGKDGNIMKASVNVWKSPRDYSKPGTGWMFTFKTIGQTFVLSQVKTTLSTDKHGMPGVVYQFEE